MSKQRGYMPKFKTTEWETPQELMKELHIEFGYFELDPCAKYENTKAPVWFDKETNGLKKGWFDNVFCNPPHDQIMEFVRKAFHEMYKPDSQCSLIVMLLPARTDTKWFHDYIYHQRTIELRFLKGRLRFKNETGHSVAAPFPSMLAIFRKKCAIL